MLAAVLSTGLVAPAPAGATHAVYPDAPDPGGDETPGSPEPIPPSGGKYFGLNDDYVDYAHHQSPASYARYLHSAGANTMKMSLEWWRAERFQDDQWIDRRWQVWKDVYDALRARNITPVFIVSAAPCWARSVPCAPGDASEPLRFPPKAGFDDEWGEFVAEVARRFPQSIIQMWNEPNLLIWWQGGVNPERYVQVLQAGYDAVQGVEAELGVEIPVAGPGVTNALTEEDTGPNDLTMSEFLSRAFNAGMKDYTDATSFNVFPLAHDQFGENQEFGAGTRFAESFRQLRAARAAAGDTDPIFVTETGIVAQFPGSPPFPYTQGQQGLSMHRLYQRLMTMGDVELMIAHRLIEPRGVNNHPIEWGFAWLAHVAAPAGQDPQTQAAGLPQPKFVYCLFSHGAYLSSGPDEAGRDATRFYPPCGIVISDLQANGDGTWTFSYGAPNYQLFSAVQCKVDDAVYAPCESSTEHTTAALGPGPHTFAVRPIDFQGQPLPATVITFPDASAPVAQFTAGPAEGATVFDSTPTFEFSSSEPGTFECKLDGEAPVPCTSPWARKAQDPLSDAVHTLQVVAIDEANNRSAPIQRSFRVEAAVPVVNIDSGPAAGSKTNDPTPTFTFSANEDATFECRYDAGLPVACNSGTFTPVTALDDGSRTFSVTATDTADKQSAPVERTFSVDTVAPTVSVTSGPAGLTSDSTPTFSFSASEGGSVFRCAVDSQTAFGPCSGPGASHTTPPLADGFHYLGVRAIDEAGNAAAAYRPFGVERPDAAITKAKVSNRRRTATVIFEATAGVTPGSFRCRLDGGAFKICSSPAKFRRLKPGKHKVYVRFTSADGVTDPTPARASFRIRRR